MKNPPLWLKNWLDRHQNRTSFCLHMIGIPIAVFGLLLGGVQLILALNDPSYWDLWWRPVVLIVLGYIPQFIGHAIEGNDVGELIPIKRLLGMNVTAISPKYQKPTETE